MTYYVQVKEGEKVDQLHPNDWKPWLNCISLQETIDLALHKHIRERGGLKGITQPVIFNVFTVPSKEINHGHPHKCFCTVLLAKPSTNKE